MPILVMILERLFEKMEQANVIYNVSPPIINSTH